MSIPIDGKDKVVRLSLNEGRRQACLNGQRSKCRSLFNGMRPRYSLASKCHANSSRSECRIRQRQRHRFPAGDHECPRGDRPVGNGCSHWRSPLCPTIGRSDFFADHRREHVHNSVGTLAPPFSPGFRDATLPFDADVRDAIILTPFFRDPAMTKLLVLYYSMYGHVETMAQAVAKVLVLWMALKSRSSECPNC